MRPTALVFVAVSTWGILVVGACHVVRDGVPAALVSPDASGGQVHVDARVPDAASIDAAEPALTVARATAMLVVRDEPLRLEHGGELAGPCVDWTRRVQRVEYGDDPATEEAGAADQAAATLVPAERVSGAHLDVDGDGQDDVSVFVGAVDVTTTSEVYVVRGGCGYSAGIFESLAELRVLSHASHGLFDVVTTETRPPGGGTYEVTYRFDGHAYRPVARRRIKVRDRRTDDLGL